MVFLDHDAAVAGIQRRADASAQDSVRSTCLKFTPKTKYIKSHKINDDLGKVTTIPLRIHRMMKVSCWKRVVSLWKKVTQLFRFYHGAMRTEREHQIL